MATTFMLAISFNTFAQTYVKVIETDTHNMLNPLDTKLYHSCIIQVGGTLSPFAKGGEHKLFEGSKETQTYVKYVVRDNGDTSFESYLDAFNYLSHLGFKFVAQLKADIPNPNIVSYNVFLLVSDGDSRVTTTSDFITFTKEIL